jgi:hypothetical protein
MKINKKKHLVVFDLKTIAEEINENKQIQVNKDTITNDEYITIFVFSRYINIVNIIFVDQYHLIVHYQLN